MMTFTLINAPAGSLSCCRQFAARRVPPRRHLWPVLTHAVLERAHVEPVVIESTQNVAVKHGVKLRQSAAYRRAQGSLLLVGEDLVREVAAAGTTRFRSVAALAGQPFPPDVEAEAFLSLSEPAMRKLTGLETVPRSVLAAEVEAPRLGLRPRPPPAGFRLLALDAVQDPGNLGTLLRTALALGWDGALLLPGCADPFSDKVLRSSRAAAFRLPVVAISSVDDWRELTARHSLEPFAGVVPSASAAVPTWMIDAGSAASASGSSEPVTKRHAGASCEPAPAAATSCTANLGQVRRSAEARRICLVLGSEGRGISPELAALCQPVMVPQPGDMESLNVAASGAILMFALGPGAADLLAQLLH